MVFSDCPISSIDAACDANAVQLPYMTARAGIFSQKFLPNMGVLARWMKTSQVDRIRNTRAIISENADVAAAQESNVAAWVVCFNARCEVCSVALASRGTPKRLWLVA